MKTFRLADNHPDVFKLEKAIASLEKLGVSFRCPYNNGPTYVRIGNKEYDLKDIETSNGSDTHCNSFPPETEYKLTYEKDEKLFP